jgi:hypothetical protein
MPSILLCDFWNSGEWQPETAFSNPVYRRILSLKIKDK